MPIISHIARRNWRYRFTLTALYTVLVIGAVTMIVPFVMMVGDSLRSGADARQAGGTGLLPAFLTGDDDALYQKHLVEKYDRIGVYNEQFGTNYVYANQIPVPAPLSEESRRMVDDWLAFKKELVQSRPDLFTVYFTSRSGAIGRSIRWTADLYIRFLKDKYGALERVNREYGEESVTWDRMPMPLEQFAVRSWVVEASDPILRDWQAFKKTLAPSLLWPVDLHQPYHFFLKRRYQTLAALNAAWGTRHKRIEEVALPPTAPAAGPQHGDWLAFARTRVPLRYIEIDGIDGRFGEFLRKRYGTIEAVNARLGRHWAGFGAVRWPGDLGDDAKMNEDMKAFIAAVPAGEIRLVMVDELFREHARKTLGSTAALKERWGAEGGSPDTIAPPLHREDRWLFDRNRDALFRSFVKVNYRVAFDYITFNSRALFNTVVLCTIMIACALTVNPLCAYALSRFQLPYAYKILLFCLATMAFPAEVTMIPNFLLMRDIGILNTFWALFLPAMANGYSIFLLKGFFDSLPQELFESAQMDGAGEMTIFLRIVVPLSKPILAVIALGAFTAAYGGFIWAFIVCQNEKYWTLMVYLFQFQNSGGIPEGVKVAALVLSAIPTLLIFIFCQNIILRGIVVPQMK